MTSHAADALYDAMTPDELLDVVCPPASPAVRSILERPHAADEVVCLADVEPEEVSWLWQARIPLGKLTIIEGDPGLGKSTLLLDVAARVTTGRALPDGVVPPRGAVVLLSAEDGLGDTVRRRLDAADADLSSVFAYTSIRHDKEGPRPPSFPLDALRLEGVIERHGAVFVVVDPIVVFLDGKVDAYSDHKIRRALHPLKEVAERTGAAIVLVRHLVKSGEGRRAIHRGGGSIGFSATARSVLLVATDPEDDQRRVLASTKSSLSAPPASLRFALEPVGTTSRVQWLGQSPLSADRLHSALDDAARGDEGEQGRLQEATDFLRDQLRDGPVAKRQIDKDARDAGHSDRTLRRAKDRLGVRAIKGRDGWKWALPPAQEGQEGQEGQGAHALESGDHAQSGEGGHDGNDGNVGRLGHVAPLAQYACPGACGTMFSVPIQTACLPCRQKGMATTDTRGE